MTIQKTIRRTAVACALTITITLGVLSSSPVLANCGTQSGGPTCKQASQEPTSPPEQPEAPDEGLVDLLVAYLRAFFA